MATQPTIDDEQDDDVLEIGSDEAPEIEHNDESSHDDADDVEIPMFGDLSEDEPSDTELVKHLRSQLRQAQRARKEEADRHKPAPDIVVGDEPVWDDNEDKWNWSGSEFAKAHREWEQRKEEADKRANSGKEQERKSQEVWQAKLQNYGVKRAALPYRDVEDAETAVSTALPLSMQELIVRVAADPAKLTYALGKSQAKLDAVAKAAEGMDHFEQAALVARLEGEMKMTKRKSAPEPDKPVRGSGALAPSNLKKDLERLEAEADRTGDRTKVQAFKRANKEKLK